MSRGQGSPFGEQLKRLRERAGLTQADLAERAGLTTQAISSLERGARRSPYPHTVNALADALGLTAEERAALLAARLVTRATPAASAPLKPPAPESSPEPVGAHNLPAQVSSFIGRTAEVGTAIGLLQAHRLVTLTGTGGSGKTRLALAVADGVAPTFRDGVWLVELAGISDPVFLLDAVARALGMRTESGPELEASIVEYLRPRNLLLLLDNCEHLIDACAALVARLLSACPSLWVCATSRELLRVPGEAVYLVPTLPIPDPEALIGAEELALYDAARLFEERAAAQLPGFRLTRANAHAVATICWRLDGIPLAIELAAARVRSMPPQQLAERLGQSLRLLTGGSRTAPARQQTLRGALDWSYNLLDEDERGLFRRLSVFAGGWDLEGATVVGATFVSGLQVDELVSRLVERSLIVADVAAAGERARYRMLEPVRQYAFELLEQSGELALIRRRHAALLLALAEEARPELRRAGQLIWLERIGQDHDNFRAALAWALSAGEGEVAARTGWALWPFWWIRAYQHEGRRWMEQILRSSSLSLTVRARATVACATMTYGTGDLLAVASRLEELAEISRLAGGDGYADAWVLLGTALLDLARGALDAVVERLERSLPLLEEHGEHGVAAQMRVFAGAALLLQGDTAGARRCFDVGLAAAEALGDRLSICNALFSLGQLDLVVGNHHVAGGRFRAGVKAAQEMGDRAGVAYMVEGLAAVATATGAAERGALLLGAVDGLRERIGLRGHTYYGPYRPLYEGALAALRVALSPADFDAWYTRGRVLNVDASIRAALAEV